MKHLRYKDALKVITKLRGTSGFQVGRKLGYTSNGSIPMMMSRTNIGSDSLVSYCRVLGYEVVLVPKGAANGIDGAVALVGSEDAPYEDM